MRHAVSVTNMFLLSLPPAALHHLNTQTSGRLRSEVLFLWSHPVPFLITTTGVSARGGGVSFRLEAPNGRTAFLGHLLVKESDKVYFSVQNNKFLLHLLASPGCALAKQVHNRLYTAVQVGSHSVCRWCIHRRDMILFLCCAISSL